MRLRFPGPSVLEDRQHRVLERRDRQRPQMLVKDRERHLLEPSYARRSGPRRSPWIRRVLAAGSVEAGGGDLLLAAERARARSGFAFLCTSRSQSMLFFDTHHVTRS